jgi:hypothetical protein
MICEVKWQWFGVCSCIPSSAFQSLFCLPIYVYRYDSPIQPACLSRKSCLEVTSYVVPIPATLAEVTLSRDLSSCKRNAELGRVDPDSLFDQGTRHTYTNENFTKSMKSEKHTTI